MDSPDYEKKPSKKSLNYRKRCFGMTSLERIQVKEKTEVLDRVKKMMVFTADDSGSDVDEILDDLAFLQDELKEEIKKIEEVDPRINDPLPSIELSTVLRILKFDSYFVSKVKNSLKD